MDDRSYPDIHFLETDTETIESNMIALYEFFMRQKGRKDYKMHPASPERLFLSWCAAIIIQQRILIEETAKKNVPRYATGKYLDNLAELFKDLKRLPAKPAVVTFRCHLSKAQLQSVIVPAKTRISFNSDIMFETVEELEIPAGNLYGDVNGQCQVAGIIGRIAFFQCTYVFENHSGLFCALGQAVFTNVLVDSRSRSNADKDR